MLDDKSLIGFSPLHRLQWEESQDRYVILYPEGVVELNTSAAEILKRCDGTRSFSQLVSDLETAFETQGLSDDVRDMLEAALENGWIHLSNHH